MGILLLHITLVYSVGRGPGHQFLILVCLFCALHSVKVLCGIQAGSGPSLCFLEVNQSKDKSEYCGPHSLCSSGPPKISSFPWKWCCLLWLLQRYLESNTYVTGSRIWGVPKYNIIGLAGGWDTWSRAIEQYYAGQLHTWCAKMAILYINNSRIVFQPKWSQKICITWTHAVIGRQLLLVTVPVWKLGDSLLHTAGPHLPGLTMAA